MAEELIGQLFAEKYRVDSLLKASEMGDFYRCRHAFTERAVVLHIMRDGLDEASAERFSSAARAAALVDHPNILAVTDLGRSADGRLYTVLENVGGETVEEALAREGRAPQKVAIATALGAAQGLAASYGSGLVHGNLNSRSMLIVYSDDGSRNVKLFDFGAPNPMAATESPVRDYCYAAPELCSGAEEPEERSDVYSLGVILYEMLAGDVPFSGATAGEIIGRQLDDPPPPLSSFRSDLSPGVEPVVLKALAKNPDMRFATANEFADALRTELAGLEDSTLR